jgi:hypothetical protein
MSDEQRALRDRIVKYAMVYTFGDYPGTDDIKTQEGALAALEEACLDLAALERKEQT